MQADAATLDADHLARRSTCAAVEQRADHRPATSFLSEIDSEVARARSRNLIAPAGRIGSAGWRKWTSSDFNPKTRRSPPAFTTPDGTPAHFKALTARSTAKPLAMPPRSTITRCRNRTVQFFENNVAPVPVAYIPVSSRKILPLHQFPRDRDVENAVTFMRQFLCRSQDAPCPGIDLHFALKMLHD